MCYENYGYIKEVIFKGKSLTFWAVLFFAMMGTKHYNLLNIK